MQEKTIYNYDQRNGLYVGSSVPDRNPMYEAALAEAAQLRERHESLISTKAAFSDSARADLERAELLATEPEFHFPAHCTELPPPADIPAGYGAYFQGDHATRVGSWEVLPLPAEEGKDPVPEPTQEEREGLRRGEAQRLMKALVDAHAGGLGFDDMRDALSFCDEPTVPKFQEQALLLRAWRSRAYAWFESEEVQAAVVRGEFTEESLAGAPPLYEVAPGTEVTAK